MFIIALYVGVITWIIVQTLCVAHKQNIKLFILITKRQS